ncbi:Formyl-CoA:oxalate CoA-transferase [Yarrowia sp. B02]|nr:Formyl-CoA:oxalate CoA-transferase [Yarrowia sp. B02]
MEVFNDITKRFKIPQNKVKLVGNQYAGPPSSFQIAKLSQGLIAAVAAVSLELMSAESKTATVNKLHSVAEFHSEQLLLKDGKPVPSSSLYPIGGHHRTKDGWVRIHDGYTHHIKGSYELAVGKKMESKDPKELKAELSEALLGWDAVDYETEAAKLRLPVSAVRSCQQWEIEKNIDFSEFPVSIVKTGDAPAKPLSGPLPLSGEKVLELNRVIAAPVCGKVLAAHGVDNTWVTSPNLPTAPELDLDFTKGKRRVSLDFEKEQDVETLWTMIEGTDMLIQSYAPGSLEKRLGLPLKDIHTRNKGIIVGTLSAYGPGKWSNKKGFDSLVQAASGMNVSEGEYFGLESGTPKPCPCQVLDHAAGYFLALGLMISRLRQAREGGSYMVEVSLAGVMAYLKKLGQSTENVNTPAVTREMLQGSGILQDEDSRFGRLSFVSHPIKIDGTELTWDMAKWHAV